MSRLAAVIDSYLRERDIRFERVSETEWAAQLRGENKHSIPVLIALGERTLAIESFFMRNPEENHEKVYRLLLRANMRTYGVRFAVDDAGDVFLVARVPVEAVTAAELDRLLGAVLAHADELFNPAISIGFAAYLERDRAWRAAQPER